MEKVDVIIIGAGAAGLMCAIEAGKRRRKVIVLDHTNKAGKKILMSGGGRCNFTNYHITSDAYISHNPHFCKSALSRYTQWDFIDLVVKHNIPFHEKMLGQLFCDGKAQAILNMLLFECHCVNVEINLNVTIESIEKLNDNYFKVITKNNIFHCQSLVIASGGLSIPTMGASPFGYHVAKQFNIPIFPTRAGLVPFTLHPDDLEKFSVLSGISINCVAQHERAQFRDDLLFTHRGLSGPAILQLSSYWNTNETIVINMLPEINVFEWLKVATQTEGQKQLKSILIAHLPKRIVDTCIDSDYMERKIGSFSHDQLKIVADRINHWLIKPNGTEGYRTAEVTLGGIDCDALSSKTMEALHCKGLYFIGEVVDVTGWLGGYNFQWAWSSGWAAGQVV